MLLHDQWLTASKVDLFQMWYVLLHLFPHVIFVSSSNGDLRIWAWAKHFNFVLIPVAAKDAAATTTFEVTQVAEANVIVTHLEIVISTICMSIIYHTDMMSKCLVAAVTHTEKAGIFLLVTFGTFFCGLICQHLDTHVTQWLIVPDFSQGVLVQVTNGVLVHAEATGKGPAVWKGMHMCPGHHTEALALCQTMYLLVSE